MEPETGLAVSGDVEGEGWRMSVDPVPRRIDGTS